MARSIIRKAAVAVAALAFLAGSTVANAQGVLRVPGGQTQTFTGYVVAGVPASITIESDDPTDIDIYVYNRFGSLVAVDDCTDDRRTSWIPTSTGLVTIRVVNHGSDDCDIVLSSVSRRQEGWRW
jgi:hypothetical protein